MSELGKRVVIVTATFNGVSLFFVGLRCFSRFRILKTSGWDDYLIIIAALLSTAGTITVSLQYNFGLGKHVVEVPPHDMEPFLKLVFASIFFHPVGLNLIKAGLGLQYLRIFDSRPCYKAITWFLIVFAGALGTMMVLLLLLTCTPVTKFWDRSLHGTCFTTSPYWYAASILTIITDAAMWALPIPIIHSLTLPRRTKFALISVFTVGILECIISAMRMLTVRKMTHSPDVTYENAHALMWVFLELNVGLICACLPTLRPLVNIWFPNLLNPTSDDSTAPTLIYGSGLDSKYTVETRRGTVEDPESNSHGG